MEMNVWRVLGVALVCLTWATIGAAETLEDPLAELELRYIGPVGNRVSAVAGVPGDPLVVYAGAASGGIFKTEDGGATWRPVFDDTPASSIGSLTVAPSDPNVVWAGTGEVFSRANISIGDGIYRSTDAGRNWQNVGLGQTGRIGRIVIHPSNPDIVFAAALGHAYGPQPERGVYRTLDGGATWEKVLFIDENTGAIDIVMDPNNPRILFAAMWEIELSTATRRSGGPGSGLHVSRDGGNTWQQLEGGGLPDKPWGKIGLAMSAADSERIYALIETSSNREFAEFENFAGVLWRSDDGGEKWKMVNADNNLMQRPLYYTRAAVAPDNANEITFMAVVQSISLDGGVTTEVQNSGWDHHDIWIDPLDTDRRITGHDGGVSISLNRGKTWLRPQLPIAQMYHVATDNRIPYNVYGNRQDGPTAMGPSNTLAGGGIPVGAWHTVGGCEVGFTIPDPEDPDTIWAGCYDGILELYDHRTRQSRQVSVWPELIESRAAADLRYRIQWTAPLAISPHDSDTVYYGSQYLHRTRNQGQTWEVISPDLTTADPELMKRTGGLTLDDAGPTTAPVLFAIAESHLEPGLIWVGTNDGQVQLTRDGGETWTNITGGLQGVPPLGTISNIEPSTHDAATAYLTVDRHQEGDTATYVYKTIDYGASWKSLRSNLPQSVFSYAHCVREDPEKAGLLYLGTENALWVSFDDGGSWRQLPGIPPAPVHWMEIQEHFGDLAVATYGRGFYILDDLSPLRSWAEVEGSKEAHLFTPRSAYRFRDRARAWQEYHNEAAGKNPEYGASIHYYLPEKVEEKVQLVIQDSNGNVVRELEELSDEAGLHRAHWDLLGEETPEVKLRTKPLEYSHASLSEKRWRSLRETGRFSLLSPPGTYSVGLKIGEETVGKTSFQVLKDPASAGTEADIQIQMEVLQDIRDLVEESAEMINAAEWARRQLEDLKVVWKELGDSSDPGVGEEVNQESESDLEPDSDGPNAEATDLVALVESLDKKIQDFEGRFFDLRLTGARQDSLRWKRFLYAQLIYLAWGIGQVDVPPTDSQLAIYHELEEQAAEARAAWEQLRDEEIADLNDKAKELGAKAVILGPKEAAGS
jgi:photosystem II stability/assembly factor-like uncharacterized protein